MVFNAGLVALVQLSLCLWALVHAAPSVDLGYSQYEGTVDTSLGITNFLGIRFAAAPVGDLRWAAPQPPPNVTGVQQATSEPPECQQSMMGTSWTNPYNPTKRDVGQSEDCLFLNVHVPGTNVNPVSSGGLPVVVWIHGGGYTGLSASSYDGSQLVFHSQNNVIAVVIQYRLGLFGFLAGARLKAGGGALNAGLLDQSFALEWVQAHISQFGGDPSRVTIWGESAGGGSVLQHIVAHGGNTQPPLFKAAMTSSAFLPPQYNYDDTIPESVYNQVLSAASCTSSSDTLSCLRNTDVGTLSNVGYQIGAEGYDDTATWDPVVDGTFIVERPTVTIGKGLHNGEILYSVHNAHEGLGFTLQPPNATLPQYISNLLPKIQGSQASSLADLYSDLGTVVQQAQYVLGEAVIICPSYFLQHFWGNNSWKGEFAIPPGTHGSDIGYYFTTSTSPFITAFSNSFLSVVISGNPGTTFQSGDILPSSWNNWADGNTEMIFNVTSDGSPNVYLSTSDSALLNRCVAWWDAASTTPQ